MVVASQPWVSAPSVRGVPLGHLREHRTGEDILNPGLVDDGFVGADGMQVLGALGLSEYGRVRAVEGVRNR